MPALEKKITEFASRVKKHYQMARIILFGSRARGDYLDRSDYDFIVVSPQFEGMDFVDRPTDVLRQADVRFAAEILCYTPEEFERKKTRFASSGKPSAKASYRNRQQPTPRFSDNAPQSI